MAAFPRAHSLFAALLFVVAASNAEAGPIVWHWSGPVTGYSYNFNCAPGADCGPELESVVPLGTVVDVFLTIDPGAAPADPSRPCYLGTAATSMQVLGRTYSGTGHVWDEGWGFGPGICQPGYDVIEIVAPAWGNGGPALPDGWVPFLSFDFYLPGLWWGGDLADGQPASISSQLPRFYLPGQSIPQRFTASLDAVPANVQPIPEPATLLLFGTGLAAAAWRRRRS